MVEGWKACIKERLPLEVDPFTCLVTRSPQCWKVACFCPHPKCGNHKKKDNSIVVRWKETSKMEDVANALSQKFQQRHGACLEAVRAPAPPVDKMTEEEMVDSMVQTLEESKLRTRQLEGQVRCRSVALSSSPAHTVALTSTLSPRCVGGERLEEAKGDERASGNRDSSGQEGCRGTRGTVSSEEAAVQRGAPRR